MIKFSKFSLRRSNKLLFSEMDIIIHKADIVGLTGKNGCGKSSLLSIIKKEIHADEGVFEVSDKLVIAHVLQETPSLSIEAIQYVQQGDQQWYEISSNIKEAESNHKNEKLAHLYAELESIDGYNINIRASKLLTGLGFKTEQLNNSVKTFSGGWRMRLNLARALISRSDILLLDEPTNHLDLDTVLWLESWLKTYSGTLVLISHDRDFLDNLCNRILHIESGKVESYSGNYSFFEKARQEKRVLQQGQYLKQQDEVKQLQKFIDRFRAQATKAKQVQSRIKAMERMKDIAEVHEQSGLTFKFKDVGKLANPLINLEQVSIGYGDTNILSNINFRLTPGSRIALLGENGAGKSTLIKLLSGDLQPQDGSIIIDDKTNIGYFAQHQLEQLTHYETPFEFIQNIDKKATEQTVRNFLGSFAFLSNKNDNMADGKITLFSGGEKARLVLAGLVYQQPGLLLLDEPTNHLDLHMREALSFALQSFQGAMVVVSHDRHLLNSICDEFYLVANKKVEFFDGNLEDYKKFIADNKKQNIVQKTLKKDAPNKKQLRQEQAQTRKLLQPIKNKINNVEKKIDKENSIKQELEVQLSNSDIYELDNKQKLKELLKQQAENEKEIDQLEQQWFELNEKLDNY